MRPAPPEFRGRGIAAIIALAFLAASCASTPTGPETAPGPVTTAVTQPFRDLGFVRRRVPEALVRAATAPYAPSDGDCAALATEIAVLDQILGPDVDQAPADGSGTTALVASALGGVVSLPYRGVVRQITGAARRDRIAEQAVLAGIARRGFLKGLSLARSCPAAAAPSPAPG